MIRKSEKNDFVRSPHLKGLAGFSIQAVADFPKFVSVNNFPSNCPYCPIDSICPKETWRKSMNCVSAITFAPNATKEKVPLFLIVLCQSWYTISGGLSTNSKSTSERVLFRYESIRASFRKSSDGLDGRMNGVGISTAKMNLIRNLSPSIFKLSIRFVSGTVEVGPEKRGSTRKES